MSITSKRINDALLAYTVDQRKTDLTNADEIAVAFSEAYYKKGDYKNCTGRIRINI